MGKKIVIDEELLRRFLLKLMDILTEEQLKVVEGLIKEIEKAIETFGGE